MRHLESIPDGYMEVETYELDNPRRSYQKTRCASYMGLKEFYEEVLRVVRLRLDGDHWEPVVIRLICGDLEHNRLEVR